MTASALRSLHSTFGEVRFPLVFQLLPLSVELTSSEEDTSTLKETTNVSVNVSSKRKQTLAREEGLQSYE